MRVIGILLGTALGYGIGYAIASWFVGEVGQEVSDGRFVMYGFLVVIVAVISSFISRGIGLAALILFLVAMPTCGITVTHMAKQEYYGGYYYSNVYFWTEPHLAMLYLGIPFAAYGATIGYKIGAVIGKTRGYEAEGGGAEEEIAEGNETGGWRESEEERGYASQEEGFARASSANDFYYDILGVKPNATQDEIRQAYREKMKEYHPDKFMNQPEWVRKQAEEMSKKLNEAYEALMKQRM